jgi:hypothetical protein
MSNKGPLVSTGVTPIDLLAPGAGFLTANQEGRNIAFEYVLPTIDADGGALTGLTKVTVGIAPANEFGENPFVDVATFANVAVATVEFNVEPGDESVFGSFPVLAFGKLHFLAAYAEDGAAIEDPVEE